MISIAARFIPDADLGSVSPVRKPTLRFAAHNDHKFRSSACF